jgi:superfamily II DNA or RNA helicase
MVQFAELFLDWEIVATLSHKLGWSHFIELLPLENELKRSFYAEMCSIEGWSVRTLRDKIKRMLFERTAIALRQRTLGPLVIPAPIKAIKTILSAPPLDPSEALAASQALAKIGSLIPPPNCDFTIESVMVAPTPCLTLTMQEPSRYQFTDRYWRGGGKIPVALVSFEYAGGKFEHPGQSEYRTVDGNKIVIYKKDTSSEAPRFKQLQQCGLQQLPQTVSQRCSAMFGFPEENEAAWFKFSAAAVPQLRNQGWQVSCDKSFNFDVVVPEEQWSADATEGSDFWFSLNLGITINGKKIPLLPIIHEAIRRIPGNDPLSELGRLNYQGTFYAPLADGRHVALPFDRVKLIVETLIELFDKNATLSKTTFDVSLPQVIDLAKTIGGADAGGSPFWHIGSKLKALFEKIKQFQGLVQVTPPKSFRAELRPYQLEGLSWLNFLREFELGGILADDMGLGKTVQTLAHVVVEKGAKRLDKPFLVVCPTSVLPNWLSEIAKFTPTLKTTALWGPGRSDNFPRIGRSDIVVTTYPLVSRDADVLLAQPWKAVVLDEAQMIKNPSTQVAQAVGKLRCDYRVCLTGTPVENHLGELWSQFNFLMPGFLKDLSTFTKTFRTPIEKQKNAIIQKRLASRVRPFLLRRTKELVAKELPEKTVIIKRVELEGAQRDLYETVRLAMYEKVKEALASKGLAKSQIIILDALLKLRQVCCDPRLVSMPAAKKVHSTAKLDLLLSMLEELLAEGKRILLFSQFTSMLDLVIPELQKRNIDFVEIRGDTKDRATPVQQFQKGMVPLFVLSLKAGGLGLNLTAADTVIHYDPWWNPAVENQATDRAHRIGQKQSVFVFKLIASGTIEERMLQLQERKKAIADGVYSDDNALPFKLTAEDLKSLFSPLRA